MVDQTLQAGHSLEATATVVELASLSLVELTLKALSASSTLSVLQVRALLTADQHGPISLSDLANGLDISLPSASRLTGRLVEDGLLLRRTHNHDRRLIQLKPSARGRRLLERLRNARQASIQTGLADMTDADRTALATGLASFSRAVNANDPS
ncbi:MarR family transcriptional regulator [Tenggerimyces flavus]|uniref:MarR family transcriptional regulator n=1 Tax=Tenggerimyces flavus TaxID=1708749 RepID=A0ABV7YPX4_9ACTN|nr:MarR family transcriptional regulator [Tenggerimyces flavus]MBM7790203.1 DNA-binding MarR family transcriptional regulator [Tenggerimyces flavus]